MNIVHFSYSDTIGAMGAAYELHRELIKQGHHSLMFVREKTREDHSVMEFEWTDSKEERMWRVLERCYFIQNRKHGAARHSINYIGLVWTTDFERLIIEADIIHLHWCMGLVSLEDVQRFINMGKKIVWTLHDFQPMTGACHYPEECKAYEERCCNCPQLQDPLGNITQELLQDKMYAYGNSDIEITAASEWLKIKIQNSVVFRKNKITVIPIGIHTDVFFIENKAGIRQELGLSEDCKVILMGAQSLIDHVKGYYIVEQMFQKLLSYRDVQKWCQERKLCVVTFGNVEKWDFDCGIPIFHMGFVTDRNRLRDIYNTADVFLFPSIQDTFGMTATEAMACGTPVVAFDVSAMSEVIVDGVNGYKVAVGNHQEMAERVHYILQNDPIDVQACRKRICDKYSITQEAEQMVALYHKTVEKTVRQGSVRKIRENEKITQFYNRCVKEIVIDQAINREQYGSVEKIFWKYNNRFMTIPQKVDKLFQAGILGNEKRIYIYGAGRNGAYLEKELRKRRICVIAFWDMNEEKWGNKVNGVPIEAPKVCTEEDRIVLISIAMYEEAVEVLSQKGFVLDFNMF